MSSHDTFHAQKIYTFYSLFLTELILKQFKHHRNYNESIKNSYLWNSRHKELREDLAWDLIFIKKKLQKEELNQRGSQTDVYV